MLNEFFQTATDQLAEQDPALYALLEREYERQSHVLAMIASSSIADPAVLICEGTPVSNVTTEGFPGKRYHAGCEVVDEIENLAVERAKIAFNAQYANVQPHAGTTANQIIMFSLLAPGDTILGLDLKAGGHLSHGSKAAASGKYFNAVAYGLDDDGFIDFEQVAQLARQHQPKMIICGSSAYPRRIDFARFRHIADEVGAYLLADISHIAGLVAGGAHPSPIDHAHFTTTSTYKQLMGPRGGLILMGRDHDTPAPDGKRTLAQVMQHAVFPYFQGTPNLSAIAAKAAAFTRLPTPEFRALTAQIVDNAQAIADELSGYGYRVLTGGTDNHMVLFDVLQRGMTGYVAEKALEACDIIVNKNALPKDEKPPTVTSGLRLGSNGLSIRGMGRAQMHTCTKLIHDVLSELRALDDRRYELAPSLQASVRAEVHHLCDDFPIPGYPKSF
jgi:glycine hydroxymethyltransferase